MQTAFILLVIAALGGATLLGIRAARGVNPPRALAFVHGLLAASGLVALLLQVAETGWTGRPFTALLLIGAAALGGFALISMHLRGRLIPLGFAFVHGLLALSGVVVLGLHLYA
jgi:hypothetical protein